jgi:hypothetical protein
MKDKRKRIWYLYGFDTVKIKKLTSVVKWKIKENEWYYTGLIPLKLKN